MHFSRAFRTSESESADFSEALVRVRGNGRVRKALHFRIGNAFQNMQNAFQNMHNAFQNMQNVFQNMQNAF
jgi:hypothetical protein